MLVALLPVWFGIAGSFGHHLVVWTFRNREPDVDVAQLRKMSKLENQRALLLDTVRVLRRNTMFHKDLREHADKIIQQVEEDLP